jgi:hypothetical protein
MCVSHKQANSGNDGHKRTNLIAEKKMRPRTREELKEDRNGPEGCSRYVSKSKT